MLFTKVHDVPRQLSAWVSASAGWRSRAAAAAAAAAVVVTVAMLFEEAYLRHYMPGEDGEHETFRMLSGVADQLLQTSCSF
jgi:hypothetical protein